MYVVMPVQADGAQRPEQDPAKIASVIEQSLHENTHPQDHDGKRTGPLKEILAHQDSLYKYISWEDPIRTLCSYIGALGILLGAHYLPLTQLALKAGAVILGVVSVTEFASRSFGSNGFLARLRPKEYKKVPESTLNATLKDIHDFVQYSVEQAQRIIFGQDLDKTFAAFLGFTALYWLIKVVSPFSLAVLTLTSLYIVPLVASPRGRAVAYDARVRAEELADVAVDKGKDLAQHGSTKVVEQSSKVQETAMDTKRRMGDIARSGQQAAVDLSTRAKGTASGISKTTAESGRGLLGMDTSATNKAPSTMNSALHDAQL